MRVNPDLSSVLLPALDQVSAAQQTALVELSSGRRVNNVSDDPAAFAQDVARRSRIENDDTFVQTATGITARLQAADAALGGTVTAVTRAISLATEAANGTLSDSDRASIANELSGIRDQILQYANASQQGSYLFAGTATGTQPFTLDTTTVPATVSYAGNGQVSADRAVDGQQIQVSVLGDQIFTKPGADLLGALNGLIQDVGNNASISTDMGQLNAALSNLSSQRVVYDSALQRVSDASTYAQQESTQLQQDETQSMGADMAAVATSLNSAMTEHNALLSAAAKLQQQTLFDYLK